MFDVRSFRGADIGSDHSLVIGKFKVKFKAQQKSKKLKPFAVTMLKYPSVAEEFKLQLYNRFKLLKNLEDVEVHWGNFKAIVHEIAMKVLGRRRGTNRERWISDET